MIVVFQIITMFKKTGRITMYVGLVLKGTEYYCWWRVSGHLKEKTKVLYLEFKYSDLFISQALEFIKV